MERKEYISPETAFISVNPDVDVLKGSIKNENFDDFYGGDFDE